MTETGPPGATKARAPLDTVPRAAAVLGFAGVVPFAAAALGVWLLPDDYAATALFAQLAYGAAILSFLGGVHWGYALADAAGGRGTEAAFSLRLGWSVLPALVAWASLLLAPVPALGVLLVAFAAHFTGDRIAAARGYLPPWYARLRKHLTALVVACLGAALVRLLAH